MKHCIVGCCSHAQLQDSLKILSLIRGTNHLAYDTTMNVLSFAFHQRLLSFVKFCMLSDVFKNCSIFLFKLYITGVSGSDGTAS